MLLVLRALLSWFVTPYNMHGQGALQSFYRAVIQITEPVVAPCRRLLSGFNTGMFDLSLVVTMLAVMLIRNLLMMIL
jgi:YggT family protein